MNKLPTVNDIHASGVGPRAGGAKAAARSNAAPAVLPKSLIGPIRVFGKAAILAIEVVEIVGFGLALL
jgi:hypothetical protein